MQSKREMLPLCKCGRKDGAAPVHSRRSNCVYIPALSEPMSNSELPYVHIDTLVHVRSFVIAIKRGNGAKLHVSSVQSDQ